MRRYAAAGLLSLALVAPVIPTAAPAVASDGPTHPGPGATTGRQSFHGFLFVANRPRHREVLASAVVAHGVFDGLGRIVEVPNRPGDPESVSRDDLVFRVGTMHVVSRTRQQSVRVNRHTCRIRVDLVQTSRVVGGTGRFVQAAGRFDARVHGVGRLSRLPSGGCDTRTAPRRELDVVSAHGVLSF